MRGWIGRRRREREERIAEVAAYLCEHQIPASEMDPERLVRNMGPRAMQMATLYVAAHAELEKIKRIQRWVDTRLAPGMRGVRADCLIVDEIADLGEPVSPRQGQTVYERDSGQLLQWDGEKDGEGGWVVVEQPEGPEMPW